MAILVNEDVKIKAGKIIRVKNQKQRKFTNEKNVYYTIWVEDHDGGNERCIFLTEKELERIEYRSSRNIEDSISIDEPDNAIQLTDSRDKLGRIKPVYNKNKKMFTEPDYYNAVIVCDEDESNQRCLIFNDVELLKYEQRANKNKEDIPKKSFLTDLLD